eukprot:GILJ01010222.1.p1 GENE.GILJ01010222.1~~GILJ01010222.1.p1  ORF type:complete len:156 (+),score=8.84 GILJ01010222.1:178-645(+)
MLLNRSARETVLDGLIRNVVSGYVLKNKENASNVARSRRAGYGADSRYCSICSSGSDLFSARRHQMHNVLPRTREDVIVISDTEVESIDQQLEQMLGHATHSNWLPMDSYVSEFPSRQAPDTGSTPITEDRHLRASVAEFGNARNRGPDSGSTSI